MKELVDFYAAQALNTQTPFLSTLKTKALDDFKRLTFPSRKDEAWRHTPLNHFLAQRFIASTTAPAKTQAKHLESPKPLGQELHLYKGKIFGLDKLKKIQGIRIEPLLTALSNGDFKEYLGALAQHEHGFTALNTAAFNTGLLIYLPKGTCLEEPLCLIQYQDEENTAVHTRHLIIAEEGSQATIIEVYQGKEACRYFTNSVTEAYLGKKACLKHYKIQKESKTAFHHSQLFIEQGPLSLSESHSLHLGGRWVRSDTTVSLTEKEASCLLNSIYSPLGEQHIDQHTRILHLAPECQSVQDYKGILQGKARAVFNGKIVVAMDAGKTQARQENKNLLLSAQAEVDSMPQLEIFTDDVLCTHGATVGQLDEDALFYLTSRGLDKEEAKAYLLQGFVYDNFRLISDKKIRAHFVSLLEENGGLAHV